MPVLFTPTVLDQGGGEGLTDRGDAGVVDRETFSTRHRARHTRGR